MISSLIKIVCHNGLSLLKQKILLRKKWPQYQIESKLKGQVHFLLFKYAPFLLKVSLPYMKKTLSTICHELSEDRAEGISKYVIKYLLIVRDFTLLRIILCF